jgi:hypothetical protein
MNNHQISSISTPDNDFKLNTGLVILQNFRADCAEFDAGLVHILRFLGYPVQPYDFEVNPFSSLQIKSFCFALC